MIKRLKYFCTCPWVFISTSNKGTFDLVKLLDCKMLEKWPKTLHKESRRTEHKEGIIFHE